MLWSQGAYSDCGPSGTKEILIWNFFCSKLETVPFTPSRMSQLRKVKGWERGDLAKRANVSGSQVTKHENGDASSEEMIERFADALDCTLDYLYARGREYRTAVEAATHMSLEVFGRQPECSDERWDWCWRVLAHPSAPRTAEDWKTLCEKIELAINPTGNSELRIVRGRG